jgi:hypothetical protein
MSRRKGEMTDSAIDRGWPHQVAIPNIQMAAQHPAIMAFCEGLSLCNRGHTFVSDAGDYIDVLCFADPEHAQRFAVEFGGEIIDPKDRPRWPGKRRRNRSST